MKVLWARTARRHRIGRAHALQVMASAQEQILHDAGPDPHSRWVGVDDRGVELEIEAVVLSDVLLVIHVMPTALRRKR